MYGVLRDYQHWKDSAHRTRGRHSSDVLVVYRWQGDDPGTLPDVDEALVATRRAMEEARSGDLR
jgi:hypothetical protein